MEIARFKAICKKRVLFFRLKSSDPCARIRFSFSQIAAKEHKAEREGEREKREKKKTEKRKERNSGECMK